MSDDWVWLDEEHILWSYKGEEGVDEEKALAVLLNDGVLFSNGREYITYPLINDPDRPGKIKFDRTKPETEKETVVLFVNCNDMFWWATADAEPLPHDKISSLYKMHKADKKWGSAKWCCLQRNMRPQDPVMEDMKKDGSWDEQMESLPVRTDDQG